MVGKRVEPEAVVDLADNREVELVLEEATMGSRPQLFVGTDAPQSSVEEGQARHVPHIFEEGKEMGYQLFWQQVEPV